MVRLIGLIFEKIPRKHKDRAENIFAGFLIFLFIAIWTLWAVLYLIYLRPYVLYFWFNVLGIPFFPSFLHLIPMFAIPTIAIGITVLSYKYRLKIG